MAYIEHDKHLPFEYQGEMSDLVLIGRVCHNVSSLEAVRRHLLPKQRRAKNNCEVLR